MVEWYFSVATTIISIVLTTWVYVKIIKIGIPKTQTNSIQHSILSLAIPLDYGIGIVPSLMLLPVPLPDSPFLALTFVFILVSYPFLIWLVKLGVLKYLNIM